MEDLVVRIIFVGGILYAVISCGNTVLSFVNNIDKFVEGPFKKFGNFRNKPKSKEIKIEKIEDVFRDEFIEIAQNGEKAREKLPKLTTSDDRLFKLVMEANKHIRKAIVCEEEKNWSERKTQFELALKKFQEFTENFAKEQEKWFNYEIAINTDVYCRYMANRCEVILDLRKEIDSYRQLVQDYIKEIVDKETNRNIKQIRQGNRTVMGIGALNFSSALMFIPGLLAPPLALTAATCGAGMMILSKYSNRKSQSKIWHDEEKKILKSEISLFKLTVEELLKRLDSESKK